MKERKLNQSGLGVSKEWRQLKGNLALGPIFDLKSYGSHSKDDPIFVFVNQPEKLKRQIQSAQSAAKLRPYSRSA